jgi:hypothetical protein
MSEKIDGEAAFVLHSRPWRETSLIVDVRDSATTAASGPGGARRAAPDLR